MFEVKFEPLDSSVLVKIEGDKAKVGYLSFDPDTFYWYFDEFDSGTFYNIGDRGTKKYTPLGKEEIEEIFEQNPGRAFWISKYEHGLVRYFRTSNSSLLIPDRQWDCGEGVAIFVVPEDATDPVKYCDSVMQEFSDWANGHIYGVCTAEYVLRDGEWEETSADECWGFIGGDHAEQSLKEEME
jgi:hypothetical protein